jgi:hypothetical protein
MIPSSCYTAAMNTCISGDMVAQMLGLVHVNEAYRHVEDMVRVYGLPVDLTVIEGDTVRGEWRVPLRAALRYLHYHNLKFVALADAVGELTAATVTQNLVSRLVDAVVEHQPGLYLYEGCAPNLHFVYKDNLPRLKEVFDTYVV